MGLTGAAEFHPYVDRQSHALSMLSDSNLQGRLFSGEKFTEVSVRRVDHHSGFFQDRNYNNNIVEGDKHLVS